MKRRDQFAVLLWEISLAVGGGGACTLKWDVPSGICMLVVGAALALVAHMMAREKAS